MEHRIKDGLVMGMVAFLIGLGMHQLPARTEQSNGGRGANSGYVDCSVLPTV